MKTHLNLQTAGCLLTLGLALPTVGLADPQEITYRTSDLPNVSILQKCKKYHSKDTCTAANDSQSCVPCEIPDQPGKWCYCWW